MVLQPGLVLYSLDIIAYYSSNERTVIRKFCRVYEKYHTGIDGAAGIIFA